MWARGNQKLPGIIRPQPPDAVGKAVVKAIEQDLAEVTVASLGLRAISKLSALAPAFVAKRSGR
jgi:hypothetical protein